MRSFNILLVFFLLVLVCKAQEPLRKNGVPVDKNLELKVFGAEINSEGSMSSQIMADKYRGMSTSDTVQVKFTGIVSSVCQVKGCWMKVVLDDNLETMVRFKNYGFFVPKDIEGSPVVINGQAFIEELGIEDQKHFARDAGKTEEEIDKINKPKRSYGFEADGVLLKQ